MQQAKSSSAQDVAHAALGDVLALAGLAYPSGGDLEITGSEPAIRTRFRVGAAGAAAQAAIGAAICDLWEMRTGRRQRIGVDIGAASQALRGHNLAYLNGEPLAKLWNEGRDPWFHVESYPVRDGRWVRVNTKYPHHRDIMLEVLGRPADVEATLKASAKWDGVELEEAIEAAGGSVGFVRTAEEWAVHPQAAAVASQPLFEIVRIGDAPPTPLPSGPRPLGGLRVLDLTRVIAGPICGRTLAEHGADVLKINGAHLPNQGVAELDTGIGKLTAFLDLRTSGGVDRLRALLAGADVFSQGYRPGSLAARGFAPEEAARMRPGIIYVELSAYGPAGPWWKRRGYDSAIQAVNGMACVQGEASRPAFLPVSALDYVTGYFMALGVITALQRRAREGGSWLVRTSLASAGRFITGLGLLSTEEVANVPSQPAAEELARLSAEMDCPDGRFRYLKPAVQLSETPAYWALPPVPLGSHTPSWPSRPTGVAG